jgi:hypothetical protein
MKFASTVVAIIAAIAGATPLLVGGVSTTFCKCQPTTGFLVTRLWDISGNFTAQDVIDEFNEGFAPIVTHIDGFYRYTAAETGNSSTVLFMNIFDTKDSAHVAQEAAKIFAQEGSLNGVISPNIFTEDEIIAFFN